MHKIVLFLIFILPFPGLAKETELKLYRPFNASNEHPSLVVMEEKKGSCFLQSKQIQREDAWQCEVEGQRFDPCFVNPQNKQLRCLQSPWDEQSLLIHPINSLNNKQHQVLDMSQTYPWAVELEHGVRCLRVAAGQSYDAMPIHYQCTDHHVLLGELQRCDPEWQMLKKEHQKVFAVSLTKAWF